MTSRERARIVADIYRDVLIRDGNTQAYNSITDVIESAIDAAVADALRVDVAGTELTEEQVEKIRRNACEIKPGMGRSEYNHLVANHCLALLRDRATMQSLLRDLTTDFPDRAAERSVWWSRGAAWMREKTASAAAGFPMAPAIARLPIPDSPQPSQREQELEEVLRSMIRWNRHGPCWCPEWKNTKADHTELCLQARAAFRIEVGE